MSGIEPWLLAAGLASTGVGMAQGYSRSQAQAKAARQQADYQRQLAETNAAQAEEDAKTQRALGEKNRDETLRQGAGQISALRTRMAQSGLNLLDDDGSGQDLLGQVAADYASKAEDAEWQGDVSADNLMRRAQLYRANGLYAGGQAASRASLYGQQALGSFGQGLRDISRQTLSYFK
ncbi:hypothetical protein dsx2_1541 [Desulfovibrio sp. X2]|uniref:hypothetical protein n=1 Tax=Desulfovibrio sp. X2 TaxID=941449 RepID=UPI0003588A80|nr:hypothetical protein [Desulfovibrio sp. X2]EPR44582.1 hypothetical protein dsx2_1541 [Desulfovibrio sp. X2]